MNESEEDSRIRKAAADLAYCRDRESVARKAHHDAMEATRRAKDRHGDLFLARENRIYAASRSVIQVFA